MPAIPPESQDHKLPGIYRGIIEVVTDPEQRKRYRVRVEGNIYPAEVESDHLPWAEIGTTFGGQFFGDIPVFAVGDAVWIMFEGGDRRFPVIMGGILNYEGGVPPLPSEQTAEYERSSRRWTRIDRQGTKLEMSPLEDELWIKMETPDGSMVRVSGTDGTITLQAEGRLNVRAPQVNIIDALNVQCNTDQALLDVTNLAVLRCRDQIDIRAANVINIGEYTPPDSTGIGLVPAETTDTIDMRCETLFKLQGGGDPLSPTGAGDADVDFAGQFDMDVVGVINITGSNDINVTGSAALNVKIAGDTLLDVEGNITIDGAQQIDVTSGTSINVNAGSSIVVDAATTIDVTGGSNITVSGDTSIDVSANANITVDAGVNMDLSCGAVMTLSAGAQMTLEAPIVTIDADAIAELLAGAIARVEGGLNLIG